MSLHKKPTRNSKNPCYLRMPSIFAVVFVLSVCLPTVVRAAVINISSPTIVEGNAGTTTVTFNITCNPCTSVNAIVNWSTMDGTATVADNDYVAKSGQIDDFGNGTSVETFPIAVTVNGDTNVEGDETFTLKITSASVGCPSLGGPGGCPAAPTTAVGTATIQNDGDELNKPPTAEANGPYSVDEGGSVVLSSAGSTDPDGDPLSFEWDLDNNGSFETSGASPTFSAAGRDGPATQTVVLQVSDGTESDTDTATVNITNVAPTVGTVTVSPSPSNEGLAVTASATFTDPGTPDTHSCTVNYGDGTGNLVGTVVGNSCNGPSHVYVDDDPTGTPSDNYTVTVTVTDDESGSDANTASHQVNNVAPTVGTVTISPEPSDEGSAVTASATFTDVGIPDTFSCTVNYGDGDGAEAGTVSGGTCDGPVHTYADNGSYPVTVSVTDDDTGVGSNSSNHQVDNVDPAITATTNSAAECGITPEGGSVDVSADFSDPGFDKAPTAEDFDASTVDWGDGNVEPAAVAEVSGGVGTPTTGTLSGSHTYATGGIFTITVTVEDDDGGTDSTTLTALVTGAGLTPDGLLGVVGTNFKDDNDSDDNDSDDNNSDDNNSADNDSDDNDSDGDVVKIKRKHSSIEVKAKFLNSGKFSVPVADVTSLRVMTCDGDDKIHVNHHVTVPATLDGGDGADHIRAGDGVSLLEGGPGADHLVAGDAGDTLNGGDGDDDLKGGKGNDILSGNGGDDRLDGKQGDDTLDGGPDIDRCKGGPGTDTLVNCEF